MKQSPLKTFKYRRFDVNGGDHEYIESFKDDKDLIKGAQIFYDTVFEDDDQEGAPHEIKTVEEAIELFDGHDYEILQVVSDSALNVRQLDDDKNCLLIGDDVELQIQTDDDGDIVIDVYDQNETESEEDDDSGYLKTIYIKGN